MGYRTGRIASLFKQAWTISTNNEYFDIKRGEETHHIKYFDLRNVYVRKGLIWDTVIVNLVDNTLYLEGLPAKVAKALVQEIESKAKKIIISQLLNSGASILTRIEIQTKRILQAKQYISQNDIKNCLSQIHDIAPELAHPYFEPELLPVSVKSTLEKFVEVRKLNGLQLKEANAKNIQSAIEEFSYLFQKIETYPLSEEQMRAAVINEDHCLLVAAAGSGKSSTLVAKAIYLVASGLAKAEEILILAFNKDAQIEVEQRLTELLNIIPQYEVAPKVKTFHSFGYEILNKVEKTKPLISQFSSGDRETQTKYFTKLIRSLYKNDKEFAVAWNHFLLIQKYPLSNLFEVKSQHEYNEYLQEMGAVRRKTPAGVELIITTMDGTEVKSFEEAQIANWLTLNGVTYKYERQYINPKNPQDNIKYHPDFYYPDIDLYHEHFAIDNNGKTPPFIDDSYLDEMKWKRKTHLENGSTLIETHSAHFFDGSIFKHLENMLREHGVKFKPLQKTSINQLISASFEPNVDCQVFISFIHHFKANNTSFESLKAKAINLPDKSRVFLFLNLFEKIYKAHATQLKRKLEIDFEEQISVASNFLETNRFQHAFKFILVDEFQDTSQDRQRMIQALLDQNKMVKLFAVGDDWQSIYRFAGSDIEIMTNFAKHYQATSINYLTQTYRSYQGIADVASTFVQKNEKQLKKKISAISDISKDQVLLYGYENNQDQTQQLNELLSKINDLANEGKLSVFLLARYTRFKPKFMPRFTNLDIKFSTIHASKGLQADYVFLLNVETGRYGFPSTLADDPLMDLVMPAPESYPHAEERRLMYVAITRAKKGVFIFCNKNKVSPFVIELASIDRVKNVSLNLNRENPCRQCDTGEIIKKISTYGVFYGCTNYPACDFKLPVMCPTCSKGKMIKRESKHGPFLSCSTFPKCKYSESLTIH